MIVISTSQLHYFMLLCTGSSHGKSVGLQAPRLKFVTIYHVENCLARLALARERTPSNYKDNSLMSHTKLSELIE